MYAHPELLVVGDTTAHKSPSLSYQFRHLHNKNIPHSQFFVKIDVKPVDPKLELPTDPYVLSEWVQNLGNADKLDDAISIVWHSKKDAQSEVVWNNLIVECVKKKKMKKHGFVPNYHTFTILLNGLAEHRPFVDNIAQARSLIDKMQSSTKANPVELNVFHVNCLLKLCGRLNNFEALQGNFNEMMNIGNWSPNQETFTIMLNSCARQGEKGFLVAIQIWNHINSIIGGHQKTIQSQRPRESDGYGPDNEGINLVMDDELVRSMLLVCKKTEHYDKGFEILRDVYGLSSATLDHDGSLNYNKSMSSFTISYQCAMTEKSVDIMLALCIGSRQYEKGILLFDEALTRGLEPTLETYDMFLTACRITEDWITGKEFFESIIATKKLELCLDSHLLNMILELAMLKRKPGNSPKKIRWVLKQIESFGPSNVIKRSKKIGKIGEEEIKNKDMRSAWRYIDQYVGKGGIDQKVARIYEEEGEFSETGRTVKGRYPKAFFDENYNEYDDAIVDSYVDTTNVSALKYQVYSLRHDLAEKNAILATVQKKLNRHRPTYHSSNNDGLVGTAIMTQESTTGKVIGNLQHEIEYLKKEVADAKTQIHIAKVARDRADRQVQDHAASHQTLRLEIDTLKRMLERKERNVKELEEETKKNESKKLDMKVERDQYNTKLKQSEVKANELEKQLIGILACKEQAIMQKNLLSNELETFKKRHVEDVEIIKREFKELQITMNSTTQGLDKVVANSGSRIEDLTSKRQINAKELEEIQRSLEKNQEKLFNLFDKELKIVKEQADKSFKITDEDTKKMTSIENDLSGRMKWLKSKQ
ncbi:3604_t:CDS:2 [Diversispora eburnea]|uniref:3604_t:CDS:1 n=1 Tax=Diversispora eburnea TaxID=1213867 RepID=A0A9N9BTD9_9GLOM|nr:3604_t:CDS:2 [Diversispora eburnea]